MERQKKKQIYMSQLDEPVQDWLIELREMTETECMSVLQGKSLGASQDADHSTKLVHNVKEGIDSIKNESNAISQDFDRLFKSVEAGEWRHLGRHGIQVTCHIRSLIQVCNQCVPEPPVYILEESGLELLTEVLCDVKTSEGVQGEAAGVVAQITSPSLEHNQHLSGFVDNNLQDLLKALLVLCQKTSSHEVFLLATAAVANVTFIDTLACEILHQKQAPRHLIRHCSMSKASSLFAKDQDSNLTLTSTWPQVTTCFQNTALVWGPCGMLMVTTPFYVYYLAQQPPRRYRHTLLQQIKLFSSVMLIILGVVEMISAFSDKQDGGLSVHFSAGVTAPIIRTITLLIALLLIILERMRGLITSGVLFIFWFLMVSANIIPFYTYIIQKDYSTDLTRISVFYIGYCFMLVELIAHCFAEKSRDYSNVLYPCPEMESSYLSRLTFGWTTGYTDGSVSVKHDGKNGRIYSYTPLPSEDMSESTPLIGDDKPPLLTSASAPGPMPSLWKVLIRTFGLELLHAQIWKVINDVLILTNPLILKALIAYVGDTTSPVWVGYLLSLGMFVSVLVQAVTFHILNHYTIALGIRVRAALTSAIYRKALTMNNEAKKQANAGEIVNLMSVDVTRVQKYCEQIYWVWAAPEEIAVCLFLLYSTFGTAMFAGLAFLLLMIGLNVLVMARMSTLQARLMNIKDQRIRVVNEVLNGIKILKLYAWEESFRDKILRIRKDELKVVWRIAVLQVLLTVSSMITPFTVGLFTFVAYVFVNGSHTLDAGTAFVGLSLFNTMKNPLTLSPKIFSDLVKSVISVNRVNRFLQCGDLKAKPATRSEKGYPLVVNNGTFTWDPDAPPTLSNIMLCVSEGSLVAIVGQVGSGKTSLISAILGDMDTVDGYVNVNGRVAYIPQQAWIQNDTVQNNILFGKSLHRRNYIKVLEACALKQDLDILPGGDKTEIGEKGINLSGGQKQRVSLARAVYNDADIYLLDDPLSAVDSHVGKHIFSKVVGKTGLLQHKTRILVTHGVHWLPQVDVIVVMTSGKISEIGSYNQLMSHHGAFSQFLMTCFTESKDDDDSEDEVGRCHMARVLLSGVGQ